MAKFNVRHFRISVWPLSFSMCNHFSYEINEIKGVSTYFSKFSLSVLFEESSLQNKDLWGNSKILVSPPRTGPKPVRDRDMFFENIFGLGQGYRFLSGPGRGIFYWSITYFFQEFSKLSGIKWKPCLAFPTWVGTASIGRWLACSGILLLLF